MEGYDTEYEKVWNHEIYIDRGLQLEWGGHHIEESKDKWYGLNKEGIEGWTWGGHVDKNMWRLSGCYIG